MSTATVLCADCIEGIDRLPSNSVDLILNDPPYFDYKSSYRKDKDSKLSQGILQQTQREMLDLHKDCIRIMKPDRAFFFYTNWEQSWWFQREYQSFLRNEIIWDKGNWTAGDLKGSLGSRYEVIFLGTKGKGWTYSGKRLADIWGNLYEEENSGYNLNRVGTNRHHPTEKPVDLYRKCIEIATNEGDFIIDPYGGSGASALAALETNRNILVFELDPDYAKIISQRIKDWEAKHVRNSHG